MKPAARGSLAALAAGVAAAVVLSAVAPAAARTASCGSVEGHRTRVITGAQVHCAQIRRVVAPTSTTGPRPTPGPSGYVLPGPVSRHRWLRGLQQLVGLLGTSPARGHPHHRPPSLTEQRLLCSAAIAYCGVPEVGCCSRPLAQIWSGVLVQCVRRRASSHATRQALRSRLLRGARPLLLGVPHPRLSGHAPDGTNNS